jgi:excisionase family DNA binding protein
MMTTTTADSPIIEVLEKRKSLMNAKDVADVTGLSVKTVYRRAAAGTLPTVKFGYIVKFDPHQIADWLREHYAN